VLVAPGVAEGSDGDAVGVGDGELSGFGLEPSSVRPPAIDSGDRSGTSGLDGVAGVGGGRVEGGGGGMTKRDRGEKMLLVRDRNDDGGKDGTRKGGSVGDGRRPKP